MEALDTLVEMFTWMSWGLYTILVIIGLPAMYRSIEVFIEDEDIWLAFFAFTMPIAFCAGFGVFVYYAPLISGAIMAFFVAESLKD